MTDSPIVYTVYCNVGYGDGSVIAQGVTEDEALIALASAVYLKNVITTEEARELVDLEQALDNYYDPYYVKYGNFDPFEGVDWMDS